MDGISFCLEMALEEVRLPKKEVENWPLGRMVQMIRVDSLCSADTSYDSSTDSSDLEVGWCAQF